mmetsp:Transcript_20815/g.57769  ORF Transcript_20815/g.57769 Transcript_20815/m.57769 type:complete len:225 (+) Transcript_20815:706-1380(+)
MVPRRGPAGAIRSTVARRRVAMQRPMSSGLMRFTTSGTRGASMDWLRRKPMRTLPTTVPAHATASTRPCLSPLMHHAASTVHSRSVAWRRRCVLVGTSLRPRLVMPYLRPNRSPTGAMAYSLYRKWGPISQLGGWALAQTSPSSGSPEAPSAAGASCWPLLQPVAGWPLEWGSVLCGYWHIPQLSLCRVLEVCSVTRYARCLAMLRSPRTRETMASWMAAVATG